MTTQQIPWYKAPTGPLPLNRGNALANGVIAVVNPLAGLWDGALGVLMADTSTTRTSTGAITTNGSTSYISRVPVNQAWFDAAGSTILVITTPLAVGSGSCSPVASFACGGARGGFSVGVNSSGVVAAVALTSNGASYTAGTSTRTNLRSVILATRPPGGIGNPNMPIWVNGVKESNSNGNTNGNFAHGGVAWEFGIGRGPGFDINGGTTYANAATELVIVWNRVLTDAEILSVSANPYQIFKPRRLPIWVPIPASGGNVTITTITGNAVAAGTTAVINQALVVPTITGNAVAAGTAVIINQAVVVPTIIGNAVAAGTTAVVNQNATIVTLTGNAVADGVTASIQAGSGVTITTIAGNAAAAGTTAVVNQALVIPTITGNAVAAGVTAVITTTLPTVARPVSDTSAGAWLPSTGTALYAMVDETTPDDTDYIYATTTTTAEMALNSVATPSPTATTGQVVRYQVWSPTGNGITVALKCGATVVASRTHTTLPTTATTYYFTLTSAQIATITDYTTLSITTQSL